MKVEWLPGQFSVCQVRDYSGVDGTGFCFTGKTDEENSLVCESDRVPLDALRRDDGWSAFRIAGVLDFSLVGILARIAGILAGEGIPIFALSTYNTDYILVKDRSAAHAALEKAGYEMAELAGQ